MLRFVYSVVLFICMVSPLSAATVPGDINGDGNVGLPEAVYALQCAAGIKTTVLSQEELENLEDAVNYAAMAAAGSMDTVHATEELDDVISYMGLSDIDGENALAIATALVANEFDCGNMVRTVSTVTYTFNGDPSCGGVTGTIAVTPQVSEGEISFGVVYTNVVQEDCTINGSGTVAATAESTNLIVSHQSDNLNVCGQQMNGTTTVTYDAATLALLSATVEGEYVYDSGQMQSTTVVDLAYTTEGLSGSATITAYEQTFVCTFEDVVIDPVCGIPTAGTITIDEYTFDFSETTCENPTVTTSIYGIPVTLSLEDAMAMYGNP